MLIKPVLLSEAAREAVEAFPEGGGGPREARWRGALTEGRRVGAKGTDLVGADIIRPLRSVGSRVAGG